jgi:hypothetical protein
MWYKFAVNDHWRAVSGLDFGAPMAADYARVIHMPAVPGRRLPPADANTDVDGKTGRRLARTAVGRCRVQEG